MGGYGSGSSVSNAGSGGYYWSSTYYNTYDAYRMSFSSGGVNPQGSYNKNDGFAVRCVKHSEQGEKDSGSLRMESVAVGGFRKQSGYWQRVGVFWEVTAITEVLLT